MAALAFCIECAGAMDVCVGRKKSPGRAPSSRHYGDTRQRIRRPGVHGRGWLSKSNRHCPNTVFEEEVLPWPRVLFLARNGGAYCAAIAAQTKEREAFLKIYAALRLCVPHRVVARARDQDLFKPFLDKGGEIRLRDC